MKRIITHLLIALVLASSAIWALPATAQSLGRQHVRGHHGTVNHRAVASHHGLDSHHMDTGVHTHGHVSHHLQSMVWPHRPPATCGRLGLRAHDHYWRSAFEYDALLVESRASQVCAGKLW